MKTRKRLPVSGARVRYRYIITGTKNIFKITLFLTLLNFKRTINLNTKFCRQL